MSHHYRALDPDEKLAATGVFVVLGSLLLPWYGLPIGGGIVKTGFGSFGWIQLALMITIGATLTLLYECSHGRRLPAPLREGTLLTACGGWTATLIVYRMFDRPSFTHLGSLGNSPNLRYGIFIAFAGAAMTAFAGMRKRRAGG